MDRKAGFTGGLIAGAMIGGIVGAMIGPITDRQHKMIRRKSTCLFRTIGAAIDNMANMWS